MVTVPVGDGALGKVVDYLGREVDLSGDSDDDGDESTTSSASAPSSSFPGSAASAPLFALPPTMDAREPISEPLHTGVKGIDALTPVGRGQCLLVLGGRGSGKTTACRDAAIAAARAGVRVAWAAVGGDNASRSRRGELRELVESFARADVLGSITIVVPSSSGNAGSAAPLGQRYAAICSAAALGERARDAGRHALLVVDDAACVPATWDSVAEELAALGRDAADGESSGSGNMSPRDLLEAAAGKESPRGTPDDGEDGEGEGGGAPSSSSPFTPSSEDGEAGEALVEYEGMLVSAAAAARRRFLGSLLQRPAKMSQARGGGSLTALVVLPGAPARGIQGAGVGAAAAAADAAAAASPPSSSSPSAASPSSSPSPPAVAPPSSTTAEAIRRRIASGAYSTLSEEQKRKLEAALSSRSSGSGSGSSSGDESDGSGRGRGGSSSSSPSSPPSPSPLSSDDGDTDLAGCVRTEVIEEFMSIADGQAVFVRPKLQAGGGKEGGGSGGGSGNRGPPSVEPASSISRIGGRALPAALRTLAATLRLDLSQAADAERFGGGGDGSSGAGSSGGRAAGGGGGASTAAAAAAAATATTAATAPSSTVARAARTRAALLQPAGHPTPVSDLFVTLSALEQGLLDGCPPSAVPRRLALLLTSLRRRSAAAAALLRRLDESGGEEAVSEEEAAELGAAMREAARELEGVPPE